MRCAVVGHVEWVEFARVPHMPAAGSIVHASETWSEPAGGGAVVARQLALLAGRCELFTALGSDELGRAAAAPARRARHRRARPVGRRDPARLDARRRRRASGRSPCSATSCCRTARCRSTATTSCSSSRARPRCCARLASARFLAATARELPTLREAGVPLDLLVGSLNDAGERYDGSLEVATVVLTDGANGGTANGVPYAAVPAEAVVDTYGAGDSFAAALAFALARGDALERGARARGASRLGGDRRAGAVRGAASVEPMSGRVAWISLTPVKATAAAPRRRGRAARDAAPGATGASTSSARRAASSTTRTAGRCSSCGRSTTSSPTCSRCACPTARSSAARSSVGKSWRRASTRGRGAHGSCAAPGPTRSRASWASRCGSSSRADGAADRGRGGAATLLGTALARARSRRRSVSTRGRRRRFRMNFGDRRPRARTPRKTSLARPPGRGRRGGRRPAGNVGRCVVTTQSPETGAPISDTLKALAAYRERRRDDRAAAPGARGRREPGSRPVGDRGDRAADTAPRPPDRPKRRSPPSMNRV